MCASSLIFRAIKWCFSLASGATPPEPSNKKKYCHREVPRADRFMKNS